MHINKTKIRRVTFFLALVLGFAFLLNVRTPQVNAQRSFTCRDGTVVNIPAQSPGGITADQACINNGGPKPTGEEYSGKCEELNEKDCGIIAYLVTFINVLSGMVGVVIVIMIAIGGIQYTAARDDPQAVSAAKTRIRNAIMALIFYLFGFAFLQWLVPGGIF